MRDDEPTTVQRPVASERWVKEMVAQAEREAAHMRSGEPVTFDPGWFVELARSHEVLRYANATYDAQLAQRWGEIGKLAQANTELGSALAGRMAGLTDERNVKERARAMRLLVAGLWEGIGAGALTETQLDGVEAFAVYLLDDKGGV